jgi:DNA helicase-2/ATP-dependent DNA helicase PcrA
MDLDLYNDAQRAAITAPDGPHLVIAGAGTGKTRTLTARVAWLMEQGVAPQQIVLLTFTRRASREMLDRVAQIAGPAAHHVRGGTFHAFAHTTLRRYADLVGYPRTFTLLDRADAEGLVGLVRDELGLGGRDAALPKRGTILSLLSKTVNTGRALRELLEADYPQYAAAADALEQLGVRYGERKRAQGVMDYDDLLVLMARLLRDHPDARASISGAARHVLVDEYQDVNRLQALISALLASAHGNLMVVGDEAQSIYAFRGAAVRHILDFPKMFPGCRTTVLEENYRSVQPVLDLANGVLASATEGYEKHLRAFRGDGPRPVLVEVEEEHDQAQTVLQHILSLNADGVDLSEQAVLFRSGSHANLLELLLTEHGIPYRKFGGIKFNEASHIKDVFALLRLVANPRDLLAWVRVLSWMPGVGATTARRIGELVAETEPPRLDVGAYKKRKYFPELSSLVSLLDEASAVAAELPVLIATVTAWYADRGPGLYEDWKKRARDLDTLSLLAERYDTLDGLLADVALDPPEQTEVEGFDDDDVLTLSTVHSAKGLEWPVVHVLHLIDGGFPSGFALEDPEAIEEERRLLYVAVTRAKDHLYLLQPRFIYGRYGPAALAPGCSLLEAVEGLDELVDTGRAGRARQERRDALAAEEGRLETILGYFDDIA